MQFGRAAHPLYAMPKLTQPFTCRVTIKRVLAFGLSTSDNNKWRRRMWTVAAYSQPSQLAWFGLSVGANLAVSLLCSRWLLITSPLYGCQVL